MVLEKSFGDLVVGRTNKKTPLHGGSGAREFEVGSSSSSYCRTVCACSAGL